jgi:F-type H+-transporting ATPase subunit delta
VKARLIARRYAGAFFRAITGEHLDASFQDFEAFTAFYFGFGGLREVLEHPVIPFPKKAALLDKMFPGDSRSHTCSFLKVLIRRRRLELLPVIAEEVEAMFRKARHIMGIQIRSAVPLLDHERQRLREVLQKRFGAIEVREVVDSGIQGGLVIWYENHVIDTSIRSKLRQLREHLLRIDTEWLDALGSLPPSTANLASPPV